MLQTCLSTEQRPATVRIQPVPFLGGIVNKMDPSHLSSIRDKIQPEVAVTCFPLNAIMAALEISHVDYLSLDVEGLELEILQTVDWTRLQIDVITVEYRVIAEHNGINKTATLKKLKDLRQFFVNTSIYQEVALLPGNSSDVTGLDVVFSRVGA